MLPGCQAARLPGCRLGGLVAWWVGGLVGCLGIDRLRRSRGPSPPQRGGEGGRRPDEGAGTVALATPLTRTPLRVSLSPLARGEGCSIFKNACPERPGQTTSNHQPSHPATTSPTTQQPAQPPSNHQPSNHQPSHPATTSPTTQQPAQPPSSHQPSHLAATSPTSRQPGYPATSRSARSPSGTCPRHARLS